MYIMGSFHMRFALTAALAMAVLFTAHATADVILLKDGKRLEGEVADKGDHYAVKTPYGTLTVEKDKVKRIVKSPAQFTAKAETFRRIARGMYDDALKVTNDPKERNRKLTAGLELLERALAVYNEAREIFSGPEGEPLDKAASEVIMEMRMYRDKMASEAAPPAPKPAPPTPKPVPVPPPTPPAEPQPVPAVPDPNTLTPVAAPAAPPKPVVPIPAPPAPSSKPKTAKELIADLASPEAGARRAAAEELATIKAPEALEPLAQAFEKEEDPSTLEALADALGSLDGTKVSRQTPIINAGKKGTDPQKRALIALFKKAGTEAGMKFLVEHFVRKGDIANRNGVASALMKHKKLAVRPLADCFRRAGGRPDIQADILKYFGVIADSKKGALFLVSALEMKPLRHITIHALFKIDRAAVPALISGLRGANHTRLWSAWILRGLTGQLYTSQKINEWTRWYMMNRKKIELQEKKWEEEEAASDWRVTDADWTIYDRTISAADLSILSPSGYRFGGRRSSRRPGGY
jgi:hypothetical protein